jgi:superfamily I DNA/RNA helicase
MGRGDDYITIMNALSEIPFSPGRKLLYAFLNGDKEHQSIKAHRLDKKDSFGLFSYSNSEIAILLDEMIVKGLIKETPLPKNKFWKIIEVTGKGLNELDNPTPITQGFSQDNTNSMKVSEEHKIIFDKLEDFLGELTDEQKLAVIAKENDIVCIAGAGSGKTRVLTHRIMFLSKYKSVLPSNILAITFTRKARDEMLSRLNRNGFEFDYNVETFNSFCEKILRKHNDLAYDSKVTMISFSDKIRIIRKALEAIGTTMEDAVRLYFTDYQIRNKTMEQLSFSFMNDCFFVRDYYKSIGNEIDDSVISKADLTNKKSLEMIISLARYIEAFMRKNGLRDFNDQIVDAIRLFENNPGLIPKYEHVLVDEYQDVNDMQVRLLNILNPHNLFIVGDPRQSIFGWRGSDVNFIIEKSEKSNVIYLKENFRSSKKIVDFANDSIKNMGLSGLISNNEEAGNIAVESYDSEREEILEVIKKIKSTNIPLHEIFILARTNRILEDISQELSLVGISHIMRNDDSQESLREGFLTLSTIHGIKGLEADTVFVLGCTSLNFPIKGSDHPIVEIMRSDDYDKESEERRLFYVAITRAKNNLYLSYAGKKHTHYITSNMLKIAGKHVSSTRIENFVNDSSVLERLKKWRRELSNEMGIPAYMILTDQSLISIASTNPMEMEDIIEVPGIGPFKAKKYGKEILRILHGL